MGYYKIRSYAGTGEFLNVAISGEVLGRRNVDIWKESCPIDQIWQINTIGSNQQVRTINNLSYMLNAKRSTWNCDVYTSNADTYVNFITVSTGIYYIQLVSNATRYLTACGTESGSDVMWEELSGTDAGRKAQQWKLISTLLPSIYTRVGASSSAALGTPQMETNATYFYKKMREKGYTKNAICGILGNMEYESYINPAAWGALNNLSEAYGLIQWKPATKFINWAKEKAVIAAAAAADVNALAYSNPQALMDSEIDYLLYSFYYDDGWSNGKKFFEYGAKEYLSPDQYKVSTLDAGELAKVFCGACERPGTKDTTTQSENAISWYDYL